MPSRSRTALLIAFATAFVHAALVLAVFPVAQQFAKYPRAAAQHLAGVLPPERILDFSPLYFHLHVIQRALTGFQPVVWLQVAATAGTAALIFLLAARFFASWIALVGAVAFALNRGITIYTPVLEPEPFLLLGLAGFLHFSLGASRRAHLTAGGFLALALAVRPSVLPLLALVPMFFALNRADAEPRGSADRPRDVGARTEGDARKEGMLRDPRASWLRPALRVLAPSVIVLAALALRNGVATGSFTPLGMNPGFVFYEGNNPISSGRSAVYPPVVGELTQEIPDHPDSPHLTYRLIAERTWASESELGSPTGPASGQSASAPSMRGVGALSTAEANRFWREKAVAFIRDRPGRWLSLLGSKAYFTFHEYGRHDLVVAHRFGERLRAAWIPAVPFALLAAFGLVGLVVSAPDWRRRFLVYGLFASQLGTMLAVYVSERQRLALVPALAFFGCAALAAIVAAGRTRALAAASAVALLALGLALPNDLIRDDRHLWDAYRRADQTRVAAFRAQAEGRFGEAAELAAASLRAAPWLRDYARPAGASFGPEGFAGRALGDLGPMDEDPSRRFDRAQLLIQAGRFDEARSILEALHAEGRRFDRGYAHSSEPLYHLALVESAQGRPERAIRTLERALERTPGDPFALARLAALTGDDEPRSRLARYFGEIDADFLVGIAELEEGTGDSGAARLGRTVRRLPEFWRARVYHAAAMGARGDRAAAREMFLRATADRQEQVMLEEHIVPLFSASRGEADEEDFAAARFRHGLVLAQYGRLREALDVLHDAREAGAGPEVERAIAQVEAMAGR